MPQLPTLPVYIVDEDGNRDDFVLRSAHEDDECIECGEQTPLMLEVADGPVHGLWCTDHVAWAEIRVARA